MVEQFEIESARDGAVIGVNLLKDKAPLVREALWQGLAAPHHDRIHHGTETGPELCCFAGRLPQGEPEEVVLRRRQ